MLDHNVNEGKRRPKESIKGRKEGWDSAFVKLHIAIFPKMMQLYRMLGILFKGSIIGTRGEETDTGKKQDTFALEFRECQLVQS